ncbi:Glycosyl transferase, family 2 [hydrothermal vent metagenome]|uniref:Glycosyl transferase, family 2 n=1 Tax=hydrothermal vent metagenome TaxID=652676 RepID=A0A3B0ZND7_9ZZZZ
MSTNEPKISIIIPVINEATSIINFLKPLQYYRNKGHELILVDGGSHDDTLKLSQNYVDQTFSSKLGRAAQMNFGAKHANNTILLFLHSDTYLPNSADTIIINALTKNKIWGRFNVELSNNRFIFRTIAWLMNLRSKITKLATGDQAIFINKKIFNNIKGYPDIPLMEDIALCKNLRKKYSCVCLSNKIITSSRRWEKNGIYHTIILMWRIRALYYFGVSPKRLAELYYGKK